ncbi:MAG: hypothetical protein WC607_03865 [Candidatus Micrarchaeia archaeon]
MFCVSLGGSLLYRPDGSFDSAYLTKLAPLLRGKPLVVGGGLPAKNAAEAARAANRGEFHADVAGIRVTWINARKVARAINGVYCKDSFAKAERAWAAGKTPVMGGTVPGFTTDADAVLLAECLGIKRLVNLSKSAAIYDRDPVKKGARKYSRISLDDFVALVSRFDERKAKVNFPFDLVAAKLAARSRIRVDFVDGRDLALAKAVFSGKAVGGTVVS